MRPDQRFDTPLLTPSTKEEKGRHDRPISGAEIVSSGIVEKALWERVEETSLALFRRGSELAAANGLILVDTKYEFGLCDGELLLADEVHTPDSSRYWYADTYGDLFSDGQPAARAGQGVPAPVAARAGLERRREPARDPRRGTHRDGAQVHHRVADHHGRDLLPPRLRGGGGVGPDPRGAARVPGVSGQRP